MIPNCLPASPPHFMAIAFFIVLFRFLKSGLSPSFVLSVPVKNNSAKFPVRTYFICNYLSSRCSPKLFCRLPYRSQRHTEKLIHKNNHRIQLQKDLSGCRYLWHSYGSIAPIAIISLKANTASMGHPGSKAGPLPVHRSRKCIFLLSLHFCRKVFHTPATLSDIPPDAVWNRSGSMACNTGNMPVSPVQKIPGCQISAFHMVYTDNPAFYFVNIPVHQHIRNMFLFHKCRTLPGHLRCRFRCHSKNNSAHAFICQHSQIIHVLRVRVIGHCTKSHSNLFLAFIFYAFCQR